MIRKFKQLAKTRLREGRLIKTDSEYSIDKSKVINQKKDKDIITELVLDNLIYLDFPKLLLMIMKAFKDFLIYIDRKP